MSENKPTCGAKTRSGKPCKTPPMANGRCRMHGGSTPSGLASVNFKHGRYSKHLPSRLAVEYAESMSDPVVLELRQEIALLDARLADLLKRVDSGESGATWSAILTEWRRFTKAIKNQDPDGQNEAIQALGGLISRGHSDYRSWGEIHSVIEQRRRLVESERKRILEAKQFITAEEMMIFISATLSVIKQNVTDKQTLVKLSNGIQELIQ